ncbi:hypothetical protein BST25_03425 [Mycobacterium heidelbergense]|uniref:Uncharacterized protein n=1 Tax=Mycobacterium heidelbergense TaxID=53376 RepID=A0A1X0DUK3_MYCHE|nr:hypothetical protein BST25_03425 [Mycobacterium heidelbergense]
MSFPPIGWNAARALTTSVTTYWTAQPEPSQQKIASLQYYISPRLQVADTAPDRPVNPRPRTVHRATTDSVV